MLLDAPATGGARGEALVAIERVELLLATQARHGGKAAAAVTGAAGRAEDLCRSAELLPGRVVDLCLEQMLSETLLELCLEIDDPLVVTSLLDKAAEVAGEPPARFRLRVTRAALSGARLAAIRDDVAIDGLLAMLSALVPLHEASIWVRDGDAAVSLVARIGLSPSRGSRRLAAKIVDRHVVDECPAGAAGPDGLVARPIHAGTGLAGALVVGANPVDHSTIAPMLDEVAAAAGAVLERRALLERCSDRASALSEACERRLGRLALDLHDGPLQNVAGIVGDVKALRQRLEQALRDTPDGPRLLGSVGDLEARLDAIDTELRCLSHSLESPAIAGRSLAAALGDEVESFRRRCGISLSVDLRGELDDLTSSQRTALVRIVQEWLSNVREHSQARAVRLAVYGGRDRLKAEITDDGRGFDVSATLVEAARRGRLGLVGVSERARLLGGSCEIDSGPGGPTRLVLDLPRWRPGPPGLGPEAPTQG